MNRKQLYTALPLVAAALTVSPDAAEAVQQPTDLASGLELAGGSAARSLRMTTHHVPRSRARAWRSFRQDFAGSWVASWDEATEVPSRIFGRGIAAPGAIADASAAELFSRDLLERHLSLLAPGASAGDFILAENVLHRGLRVVSFLQTSGGRPVIGGQLSFRFKNDRLIVIASEALPHVPPASAPVEISDEIASASSRGWIEQDVGPNAQPGAVAGPFVLPLVSRGGVIGYRPVLRVTVDVPSPRARFDVYVDVTDGSVVAREQTLRFASGQVLYNAPVRYPLAERDDYPASQAELKVGGQVTPANNLGVVSFADGGPALVDTSLMSPIAAVQNMIGPAALQSLSLDDGGVAVWDASADADDDAQVSAFIHAQIIKDYAKSIAPEMQWLDGQLPVKVNHNDQCNAFYDGTSINFYRQSNNCENTGRLADVVYHELGHGFHHHAVILGSGQFEPALSEGVSDYLAATFTGDPGMGRGFFFDAQPLRHIDPTVPKTWPKDVHEDPHQTGLIIGGALWDLRELLVAKYGEQDGVALANQLFYDALRNTVDIPSMYVEILAADDDDGNLENGTPNVCEIVEAFGTHGLRQLSAEASALSVEPPTQDGHQVSIALEGLFPQCGADGIHSAYVLWQRQGDDDLQSLPLEGGPASFSAQIPSQPDGTVVRYRVEVQMTAGTKLRYPDNPADPTYQFFIGEVTPLYCTDFETDPAEDGWTHQLLSGAADDGADDWQWDSPNGNASNGDPSAAYSGDKVFGNDLGHDNFNGLYQGDKVNAADSPVIDVSGHDNVRLQYRRWLNVEDGYFDQARIYANGQQIWTNLASPSDNATTHHTDREWRFHDVDLSDQISEDGTVQLRFEIQSDQGLHLGGWTLDDVCVVAYEKSDPIDPECGNGKVELGEDCDDGNATSGDGCSSSCTDEGDNGLEDDPDDPVADGGLDVAGSGCGCRLTGEPGPRDGLPWAILALGLFGLRRRRRG